MTLGEPVRDTAAPGDGAGDGPGNDEREGTAAAGTHHTSDAQLLTRLNRRGFRLVQVLDLVGVTIAAVGPMWLRYEWDWPTYVPYRYVVSFALAIGLVLVTTYLGGLYEREPRLGAPSVLPRAARAATTAVLSFALLDLVGITFLRVAFGISVERTFPFPLPNLLAFVVLASVVLVANRRLVHHNRHRLEGPPRLLLVGHADEVAQARAHLDLVPEQARIVGTLDDPTRLREAVAELGATDVALLSPAWLQATRSEHLAELEDHDVTLLQRVTAIETMYGLQRIREVGGLPFVLLRGHAVQRSRRVFKRLTDLTILLLLLPVAAVVVGLVALYLLVVSGRPLLFTQPRVGVGGEVFTLVKFRTMRMDAEAESGAVLSSGDEDPRVVPGARWLRATRLDELPQLWNILKGEMSLVGPRPERPELTAHFEQTIPGYARRHELPPGLTGLAQIHGRYHTDAEYKLGYDLQYLVNWSPVLDLEILLRTVYVVLARRV